MAVNLSSVGPPVAMLSRAAALWSSTNYTLRIIFRANLTLAYQIIWTFGNNGSLGSNSWEIGITDVNTIYFATNTSGGIRDTYLVGGLPATLTNGVWYEAFFVYAPLPVGATMWVAPAETMPSTNPLLQITPYTSPDLYTGSYTGLRFANSTFGSIYQPQGPICGAVAWTGVSFTQAQCEANRLSIPPATTANLYAWWAMANSGTATIDGSGNSRPLTAQGTIVTAADPLLGGIIPFRRLRPHPR